MENIKILYPITEKYLQNYSINNPPLIPLYRNYSIQEEYDRYRSSHTCFIFIDNMKELLKNQQSILRLNDFPYYTTDNIKHYVLWFNKDIITNTNDFIKSELDKYFSININLKTDVMNKNSNDKKKEYPIIESVITYWINMSENMSIKEILHVHIFTKSIDI